MFRIRAGKSLLIKRCLQGYRHGGEDESGAPWAHRVSMACARDMFVSIVRRTKTHGPGMRCEDGCISSTLAGQYAPAYPIRRSKRGGGWERKERNGGNEIQQEPNRQDKTTQELRQCDTCVGKNQLKWKSLRPIDSLNIHQRTAYCTSLLARCVWASLRCRRCCKV